MKLKLDADQIKAVEHFEGPALVVAGPGSGKTTVIKERILHLIREYNVDPRQILALAFNKEAAKEMEKRILSELWTKSMLPEIRTLHAFGLSIIHEHYDRLKRKNKPEVWSSDPERTIKQEIQQLKRNLANVTVTIYKIESELTGKCYIGQTTNPERRRSEHFSFDNASNPDLRQAMLNEGKEHFKFDPIDEVEGKFANRREAKYIEHYRNCAVINLLEPELEQLGKDKVETYISIYKIENKTTGVCYIVQSTDAERNKVENFIDSSNDEIRNIIENEGIDQFTFKVLHKDVLSAEVSTLVKHAIKNASNNSRAVFNRNNPLKQRYSDQLMIELFCQHFNIYYEEFLKRPTDVGNLTEKIEDFEKITDKVQKAKRETTIDFSGTSSIDEIVHSIIESIDDPVVQAFAEKYEKKKKEANAIDFEDMILYAVYLLEVYPDIRASYREKYNHVLIDEFQDVSPIDFRLTKPLSENFFVVGDDDQAIYGFRGGNSEIMLNFHNQGNVQEYKITRNYRSTSTIVEHSKTLIEYNTSRISKNLHAKNPARPPIKVLETTQETVKSTFLREFAEPVCQTQFIDGRIPILESTLLEVPVETQKIGIPVRYRSEVEKLRQTFRSIDFTEIKGEMRRKKGDPFKIIGRSKAEIIEGSTIHSMKGKEYDKVILIHNTLGEDFPFQNSDNITEERRVFYVAMTRAKQELLLLGGDCQFVMEAGLSAIIHKRRKQLEKISKALNSAIVHRIDIAKKELDNASETMQAVLISTLRKAARTQCEYELEPLRSNLTKTKKAAKDAAIQLETELPTTLKAANDVLLKELILVLDVFELQVNSLPATTEPNNGSDNFEVFTESVRLAHKQMLDSLKNHGLEPIEACGKIFSSTYHEKVSPDIYSGEVPAGRIAKEERHGYLLHDQIIRKAEVVVSKRKNIWTPDQLGRIIEIYLNRLMFAFKDKYKLSNIDQYLVKQKMVKYLLELEDEAIQEIDSFASKNVAEVIRLKRYIDYCAEQKRIHLCTDVFRSFWERMWEIIEQSRNPSESQTKAAAAPVSSKIKQVQPSVDPPVPTHTEFTDGEIVKGIVVDVNRDEVMIDIGFKSEGYIPASEFDAGQNDLPTVQVGDEIDVYIMRREDSEGQIVLSKKIADQTLIWDEIATAYEAGTPVMGHIIERIKGGLRVSVGSLQGFLPASQVELRPIQNLEQYVGQTLEMKVISLSKRRHNIVLSRRAWLETEFIQKRSKILNTLKVGQDIIGVVKNITDFGAFVDLGGVDGLLHKSEMAWKRINHPSQVVSVGEEMEVKVIEFDQENGKISLSLKQMTTDPWKSAEEKYPVRSTIQGTVTNIVNFGAFVQLEEGIEGLIHVSKMPLDANNTFPSDFMNKNDEVEVIVLEISKDSKRISLGMKSDRQNPFEAKKVVAPSDEPPPIVKIATDISNELTEQKISGPIKEIEAETPIPKAPPIVAEDVNSHSNESTDSIIPKPHEEVVNTPPISKELSEILNSQIQVLKPETLETEIVSEPLETVDNNTEKTLHEYNDILNTHIEELKPEIPEIENPDNITKTLTLEIEADSGTPVDPTALTRSDSPTSTDSDAHQIKGEAFSENEVEHVKKNLGYYLRQGGRFAVEKIKGTIFRKPTS